MLLEVVDEKMDEVHKHMEAYLDWLGPEDAEALQRLLERTYEYSTKVHEENQD
jgi:hypothetical protein